MVRRNGIGSSPRTSLSSMRTSPLLASIMRLTVRSSVVFPDPLRPRTAVVVPSSNTSEIPSSSCLPPAAATHTFRNSIAALIAAFFRPVPLEILRRLSWCESHSHLHLGLCRGRLPIHGPFSRVGQRQEQEL